MIDHPHTYVSAECAKKLTEQANRFGLAAWSKYCLEYENKSGSQFSIGTRYSYVFLMPELWVDDLGRRYVRWFIYEKPEWASMQEVLEFVEKALVNETTA